MLFVFPLLIILLLAGCNGRKSVQGNQSIEHVDIDEDGEDVKDTFLTDVVPTEKIAELEDGLLYDRYMGDYGFDEFLSEGGASSDGEVIGFLTENLLGNPDLEFIGEIFGCSTIMTQNTKGEILFGRNFDWNFCDALIVMTYPENAYASVSTVNMDFIRQGVGGVARFFRQSEERADIEKY